MYTYTCIDLLICTCKHVITISEKGVHELKREQEREYGRVEERKNKG